MEQINKDKVMIQKIVNEHEIKISQKLVKSSEKYKIRHSKFEDVITSKVVEGKNLYLRSFLFLNEIFKFN